MDWTILIFPDAITITPSVEENYATETYKEKVANYLVGLGFNEILTNSITNSAYFTEEELQSTVKMLNNLSAELNVMRPSMLETGLEVIAHNLNRKNNDLSFLNLEKHIPLVVQVNIMKPGTFAYTSPAITMKMAGEKNLTS